VISKNKTYKIALIGDCLSYGGAEKVHALLSLYFEKQGFEVQNCIFRDLISYQFAGSVLNLGKISPNSNTIIRKWNRFFALKEFIHSNNFDFVIDFRMRPSFVFELILSRLVYPKNTIFTVLSGVLQFYFPKNSFLAKLIYANRNIVTVSEAIEDKIRNLKITNHVKNLYQPFDFESILVLKEAFAVDGNYILAVGNMDTNIKQIDKLIVAYSQSNLPKQNIKLIVLGEGKLLPEYQMLADKLKLTDLVLFKGTLKNPFPYYKKALFLVLSSKNEGLSNAIIESLACQTPVVAFDCFSGPREIIENNKNGLLVENQNFDKLILAMNNMIENKELYQDCKKNAVASVSGFSIAIIGKQWLDYFKIIER
jgi:N-acetylgalactosamine-N,N'-diacetylbacillosaminyl-diphospho-undecaprenol 4-alpha-N-acetylgalactosaminyltransferase